MELENECMKSMTLHSFRKFWIRSIYGMKAQTEPPGLVGRCVVPTSYLTVTYAASTCVYTSVCRPECLWNSYDRVGSQFEFSPRIQEQKLGIRKTFLHGFEFPFTVLSFHSRFWVSNSRFWVSNSWFWVSNSRFWVSNSRFYSWGVTRPRKGDTESKVLTWTLS